VFTEYFQSVYRPNTSDADLQYERQVQNWLAQKTDSSKCVTSVDINDVQRCVDKMKNKKAAGHDGIMAEHVKLGGPQLYVHLCLLFNSMIRHSYVPDDFGHGIIIPLHGDSSKLELYRVITLSPTIAKLFELVLVDLYEHQLATHDLQYGFKNNMVVHMHCLLLRKQLNISLAKIAKFIVLSWMLQKRLTRCYIMVCF